MIRLEVCPICEGKIEEKYIDEYMDDFYLGEFKVDVCLKCHEKFYYEDIIDAIEKKKVEISIFSKVQTDFQVPVSNKLSLKDITNSVFNITPLSEGWKSLTNVKIESSTQS